MHNLINYTVSSNSFCKGLKPFTSSARHSEVDSLSTVQEGFSNKKRLPLVVPSVGRKLPSLLKMVRVSPKGELERSFDGTTVVSKGESRKRQKRKAPIVMQTYARSSVIPVELVGITVGVHSGRSFDRVSITEDKVGRKFGEFAVTRRFVKHKVQKSKQGRRRKF